MTRALTITIALLLQLTLTACQADPVYVIDGDTIAMGNERIRLSGIDAFEKAQFCRDGKGGDYPCGLRARDHLHKLIAGAWVSCQRRFYRDVYGRSVAACVAVRGRVSILLNAQMVLDGWALDWPKYSHGRYAEYEKMARQKRRGVWAGTFEKPWQWRRR